MNLPTGLQVSESRRILERRISDGSYGPSDVLPVLDNQGYFNILSEYTNKLPATTSANLADAFTWGVIAGQLMLEPLIRHMSDLADQVDKFNEDSEIMTMQYEKLDQARDYFKEKQR